MNKYSMSWSQLQASKPNSLLFKVRMRWGAQWPTHLPHVSTETLFNWITTLMMIALILLAYALVGMNDARAQADEEAIHWAETTAALLNKQTITDASSTWAAKCTDVIEATK